MLRYGEVPRWRRSWPRERRTTQAAEGLPRRRFTVAEVEAMVAAGLMDEDERVELIGGELGADVAEGH